MCHKSVKSNGRTRIVSLAVRLLVHYIYKPNYKIIIECFSHVPKSINNLASCLHIIGGGSCMLVRFFYRAIGDRASYKDNLLIYQSMNVPVITDAPENKVIKPELFIFSLLFWLALGSLFARFSPFKMVCT